MVLVPYGLFMHLISGAAHSLHGSEREEWVLVPVRAVYADYIYLRCSTQPSWVCDQSGLAEDDWTMGTVSEGSCSC